MKVCLNRINDNIDGTVSFSAYLMCFIFLYALFVPARIKQLLSFNVEGKPTTNEFWILLLVCIVLRIVQKSNRNLVLQKQNRFFAIIIYIYIVIIIVGGFNAISISQYIYASLIFIMPMLLFFPISYFSNEDIKFLLKMFVVICLIYSIFAVILSTNYAFLMDLVGNPAGKYRGYSQYRASMMLGSSIEVSYYLNMTLPLCFYIFYKSTDKKWKAISAFSIATNIIATFILLSRTAVLCMVCIIIFNLFIVKNDKNKLSIKIVLLVLLLFTIIFTVKRYNLSRLALGFNKSESSVALRLKSGKLGLHIFTKHPIWGSGIGRYFKRIYDNNYISIDGFVGLIDPHNMYILILSEMGMFGFILSIVMFFMFFKRFLTIKEKLLSQTACLTLFAFLLDAMGGSHLFISISFSIIFWIYMGVINNIYVNTQE